MGDSYQIIADLDATEAEAEALAEKVRTWLIEQRIIAPEPADCVLGDEDGYPPGEGFLQAIEDPQWAHMIKNAVNGVEFIVGRTVFHTLGLELKCRACGKEFEPEDEWNDAVTAWYEGDDEVKLACPQCGHEERLVEWDGPWPWALGHLGLQFWNWPPLSPQFIQQVSQQLGHRTRVVRGKL
jgi:DNA-directed RNA polymerase subunit RPC12/RpoP